MSLRSMNMPLGRPNCFHSARNFRLGRRSRCGCCRDRRRRLRSLDQIDQSRRVAQRECDQDPTWADQINHGQGRESRRCHRLHFAAAGVGGSEVNNDSGIMAVFNMDISRVNGATGVAQRPWPRRANMVRSKTALTRVKHRIWMVEVRVAILTDLDEMLNKGA